MARQGAKAQRWVFRQDEQDTQDFLPGRKPTRKIYLVNPVDPVKNK